MKTLLLLSFCLMTFGLKAQSDAYYDEDYLRYDDYTYLENIKSVQLYKKGSEYSYPVLKLHSNEQLQLAFDDLESSSTTFYYTLIHCNYDWTPSQLMPMEYIDGLVENFFNHSFFSLNTTIPYSHYEALIPNRDFRLTKSGNYLLKVYPEGEPDHPIITRRLYVVDQKVSIETTVQMALAPADRESKQELFLKINTNSYPMPDLYSALHVQVRQNWRKDNIIEPLKPKQITANYLYYNLIGDIVFNGTNEFRKADIRSFQTRSAHVASIDYDSSGYQIKLLPDGVRSHTKYLRYHDINGQFGFYNWDNQHFSSKIESDYAFVDFTLPAPQPFEGGDLFIFGGLTNWRMDRYSRLLYDAERHVYHTTLLLKQGYYDYAYVFLPTGQTRGDMTLIEGNHSETENVYTVFVYYRDQGDIYDKLIGIQSVDSKL